MESINEIISGGDFESLDLGARTLRFFVTNIDERENRPYGRNSQTSSNYYHVSREVAMRSLYPILPHILPGLL